MSIPYSVDDVPMLSTSQMVEVDRVMTEDLGIDLVRMMENAGRTLAHLARERFLGGDPRDQLVCVLAGPGGNGGGALVCARRLHGYGAHVNVVISKPNAGFAQVPGSQLAVLEKMGMTVGQADSILETARPDLIVDGVIGYSLRGAPRGGAAGLIRWANASSAPVLALDVPSGVDAGTGVAYDPAIRATATLTLALPKVGLLTHDVADRVGELYLADIGVPPELYRRPGLGLDVGPIFAQSDLLRLR